ncbi:hypothetical protein Ddye_032599 [Dipteronia dyeriana]|uniref:Uncharacterized protein n=1 Tax=Dipteronia dyeriana TaxID=168575 RepID=A0AAD9WKG5_9ROSI|nr:hypothetical protein Ddye_032599 [Dipteronia dyeriana]
MARQVGEVVGDESKGFTGGGTAGGDEDLVGRKKKSVLRSSPFSLAFRECVNLVVDAVIILLKNESLESAPIGFVPQSLHSFTVVPLAVLNASMKS